MFSDAMNHCITEHIMKSVNYRTTDQLSIPYITVLILTILILIFVFHLEQESDNELLNYGMRAFYHANTQHLIANGISLLLLSTVETALGWKKFLGIILFLWATSSFLLYVTHSIFPSRKIETIGFSGVIYGLYVVYFSLLGATKYINIGILIASIIPQFFMKGISVEGHLCGIVSGGICVALFGRNKFR
jgi:membrane associated rhomboid family serine protease